MALRQSTVVDRQEAKDKKTAAAPPQRPPSVTPPYTTTATSSDGARPKIRSRTTSPSTASAATPTYVQKTSTPPTTTTTVSATSQGVMSKIKSFFWKTTQDKEDKKYIKKRSKFIVSSPREPTVRAGETKRVEGYSSVTRECDFMNVSTGVYTTPRKGRYRFEVYFFDNISEGLADRCFCTSDGSRKLVKGCRCEDTGGLGYQQIVKLECEEGVGVWVEAVGVEGTVHACDQFKGRIVDFR